MVKTKLKCVIKFQQRGSEILKKTVTFGPRAKANESAKHAVS